MAFYGLCLALVLAVQTCTVYGQEEIVKGSITLVVDDSSLIPYGIHLLKDGVNTVFDVVLSSNASHIDDFVLVTFNKHVILRTITKDRNELQSALSAMQVYGKGQCLVSTLKGIEEGLSKSLPHSFLYVFTDSPAMDYSRFEQIKRIAQRDQSQVNIILPYKCGPAKHKGYQVYYKLAEATNGKVFNLVEDAVQDVLKYAMDTITGRKITGN